MVIVIEKNMDGTKKMVDDVTIMIKTFQRPDCLERCVKSIRKFYPDIQISIADDSLVPQDAVYHNMIIYPLPFDVGLSAGRNFLLDKVQTPYILIVDDDFVFTKETDLHKMKELLISDKLDILAGSVKIVPNSNKITKYEHLLKLERGKLYYVKKHKGLTKSGLKMYDVVLNFFMAKTDSIKKVRWDDDLKIVEHTDFFLRAKKHNLKIAHCPDIVINHYKNNKERPDYDKYRYRHLHFEKIFKDKHKINEIVVNYTG